MARTLARPPQRPAVPPPSSNGVHAPMSPVATARPVKRKPSWMLGGVALVLIASLFAAWVFSASSKTVSILVADHDLAPGEVVDTADFRVVQIGSSGQMRAITPDQQALVVGRAARGPIPAGTVLNTDLFASKDQVVPAGQVVVGAALEPGAAPTARLAEGDRVDLIGIVKAAGGTAADAAASSVLTSGTVWAVERPTTNAASAKVWVSVLVPSDAQVAVAQAAAEGRLRLSLVGAGG